MLLQTGITEGTSLIAAVLVVVAATVGASPPSAQAQGYDGLQEDLRTLRGAQFPAAAYLDSPMDQQPEGQALQRIQANSGAFVSYVDNEIVLSPGTDLLSYADSVRTVYRWRGLLTIVELIDTPGSRQLFRDLYLESAEDADTLTARFAREMKRLGGAWSDHETTKELFIASGAATQFHIQTLNGLTRLEDTSMVDHARNRPGRTGTGIRASIRLVIDQYVRKVTSPPDDDPASWWTSQDIGAVGAEGSFSASTSGGDTTYTAGGSGADIWNQADEFRFAYQRVGGGATITARITSQDNTDPWAKAGVMLRDTLSPGSKHAFAALTPGNGLAFQRRPQAGGSSQNTGGGSASAPVWVRLTRVGDTLTASRSPDGQSWSTIGSAAVPMGDSLYAGMAVTSHNDGTVSEATFTSVSLDTTAPTPPADSLVFAANAGGAAHTTGGGTTYRADTLFSGGQTAGVSRPIAGTQDDALYQSERYGDFSYAIPVPTGGDYEVTLRFAETCWQSSGQRVFDVEAEGQEVVTDLDLYAEVGRDAAYDVTRTVSVTDGTLNLTFTTDTDNATVSAIAIRPAP